MTREHDTKPGTQTDVVTLSVANWIALCTLACALLGSTFAAWSDLSDRITRLETIAEIEARQ